MSASEPSQVGENMYPHWLPAKYAGSTTHGPPCVVSVTVWPDAWMSPIGAYAAPVSGEKRQESMLNFTAAPSSGVPSWNVIPSRTVIVHSV